MLVLNIYGEIHIIHIIVSFSGYTHPYIEVSGKKFYVQTIVLNYVNVIYF